VTGCWGDTSTLDTPPPPARSQHHHHHHAAVCWPARCQAAATAHWPRVAYSVTRPDTASLTTVTNDTSSSSSRTVAWTWMSSWWSGIGVESAAMRPASGNTSAVTWTACTGTCASGCVTCADDDLNVTTRWYNTRSFATLPTNHVTLLTTVLTNHSLLPPSTTAGTSAVSVSGHSATRSQQRSLTSSSYCCSSLYWGLYINKLFGRPPQYAPALCKLIFDLLTLKVVPSHVWRGLPLCQF